ncbi:MAG: VOC family protein [Nitrospirae bacterium]|nr:VOC family protein [Nitrospirota bacterium]
MVKYIGINHVALATADMDKTIRWRDLLGMRLVAGMGRPGNRQYFFGIDENVMISFFEWSDVEPVPDKDPGRPVKGPFSLDHLCIQVASEDEIWVLKDRLESAGVWVTEVIDNGFIHSIFSTDPNNIQIEFCCAVKGVSFFKNPKMVDSKPSAVTMEGTESQSNKWLLAGQHSLPQDRKIYQGELKKILTEENKW